MTEQDYIHWAKNKIGWILIVGFCSVPLVLWFTANPLDEAFYDVNQTFLTLGKLTGLVGFVLYAINMLLTIRKRWLESLFNGLNRVYIAHHITGGIALSFLVFHPLFLALQYVDLSLASSINNAAQFLLPQWIDFGGSFANAQEAFAFNSGIIAFLGMVVLLIITFYAKLPYRFWLFTHKFLGVAFLFAGLHVVLIDSDVSDSLILTLYMLIWISIGLFAFIYKTLLGNVLIKRAPYKVDNVITLPGNTVGVYMSPMEQPINFVPGQFIYVRFKWCEKDGIIDEIHPFSVASEPGSSGMALYMRALGDYTTSLKGLKSGAIAEIEGAFGKFSYTHFSNSPQIWVAGGIGITPFLSMARSYTTGSPPVDLFYSTQTREEMLDQAAIAEYLPARYSTFKYHPFVYAETNTFLSAQHIVDTIQGSVTDREIFICGPPAMMKSLRSQLIQLGVKNHKIHTEEFTMS